METKFTIRLYPTDNGFNIEIDRQYVLPNGAFSPAQTWGVALSPEDNLDNILRCMWEGDTGVTSISLSAQFPAEYEYLKAKFGK